MRQKDVDRVTEVLKRALRFSDESTKPGIQEVAGELARDFLYDNAELDVSGLYDVTHG